MRPADLNLLVLFGNKTGFLGNRKSVTDQRIDSERHFPENQILKPDSGLYWKDAYLNSGLPGDWYVPVQGDRPPDTRLVGYCIASVGVEVHMRSIHRHKQEGKEAQAGATSGSN